jgi:CorA-like Mg2+ transporter protein
MTRYQTEMASEQSRSVMIFTVITIIFLPLSFFSSIFGMNVSDWSGTSTNPTLDYVLEVMSLVSLAVVVIALVAAFNVAIRRIAARIVRRFWHRGARPLWHLLAKAPVKKLRLVASKKTEVIDLEKGLSRTRPLPKPQPAKPNGAPPGGWRPRTPDQEKEFGFLEGDEEGEGMETEY